jgi:ABC-type multidrug transport system permease subunit
MLRILLAKDLRRVWRNPLPAIINIALPLCITAIIGMVFGRGTSNEIGRVRFALVDEDQSMVSSLIRRGIEQNDAKSHLDPVFLDRKTALAQINRNELSGAIIIPADFTGDYMASGGSAKLELVKNPAESIQPALLEEMAGLIVTKLNLHGDDDPRFSRVGWSTHDEAIPHPSGRTREEKAPAFSIFAWALPGMTAMFLIFLASSAMTDFQREVRIGTLERFHTLREAMLPFIAGKVVFALVFLLICAAIMLGGGGLIFGIRWNHPLVLIALTAAYAAFAAGLAALQAASISDERRGNTFGSIAGIVLGTAGGCTFPRGDLPAFVANHITPLLPSYWFADAARNLQSGSPEAWLPVALGLMVLGAILIAGAVAVINRRLSTGTRA